VLSVGDSCLLLGGLLGCRSRALEQEERAARDSHQGENASPSNAFATHRSDTSFRMVSCHSLLRPIRQPRTSVSGTATGMPASTCSMASFRSVRLGTARRYV